MSIVQWDKTVTDNLFGLVFNVGTALVSFSVAMIKHSGRGLF